MNFVSATVARDAAFTKLTTTKLQRVHTVKETGRSIFTVVTRYDRR